MSESKMLKVVSIIMIVLSAITILVMVLAGFGSVALLAVSGAVATAPGATALLLVATIVGAAIGVFELVVGIIGVKNWNNPSKAGLCFNLGIALIVLAAASIIFSIVTNAGSLNFGTISLNVVTSLLLPVLYVVGANQLKGGAK